MRHLLVSVSLVLLASFFAAPDAGAQAYYGYGRHHRRFMHYGYIAPPVVVAPPACGPGYYGPAYGYGPGVVVAPPPIVVVQPRRHGWRRWHRW